MGYLYLESKKTMPPPLTLETYAPKQLKTLRQGLEELVQWGFFLDIPESISTGYRSTGLRSRGSYLTPKGRGAHTIGSAHCTAFSERFHSDSTGKLALIDASLDKDYAAMLTKQCPVGASASVTVNNDPHTPMIFDNQYYGELLTHKGLFQSDSALLNDARTMNKVVNFANNQEMFLRAGVDLLRSSLVLECVGVETGGEGEIRQSCSVVRKESATEAVDTNATIASRRLLQPQKSASPNNI
ncbi:hypothetical protein RJ639_036390 [Escallonia herrerae]|uniref:peroxidase n=1 Tax=Escallonia herrerae TaxID=1293975 RepID=A0AA88WPX0_9ASTE|nr:hypothetical protein RJ639_036390 [Escallonia herrerae]